MRFLISLLSVVGLLLVSACKDRIADNQGRSSDYLLLYDGPDLFIHIIHSDGTGDSTLTIQGVMPKYLPDGKRFVLKSSFGFPPDDWYAVFDMSTQTVTKVAFLKSSAQFGFVSYSISRDGTRIAYTKPTGQGIESDIYVADVRSASSSRLTSFGSNTEPVWSSDGKQISYTKFDSRDSTTSGYFVNSDGSMEHRVPYLASALVASPVQWSPDGSRVIFVGKPDSSKIHSSWVDVYVADVGGGSVKRATFDGSSAHCCWSPDGMRILFSSGRDGGTNLYTMNADGSAQSAITKHGGVFPATLEWSPDGKKIAYVYQPTGQSRRTIRVVNSDGTGEIDTGAQFRAGFSWRPF